MTTGTTAVEALPPAPEKRSAKFSNWYYGLHPGFRLTFRWILIVAATGVAFWRSIMSLVDLTVAGGIGGYVWTVPVVALLATIAVTRRSRSELPIHDRQTDMIIGIMGLVLALLVQWVLLPRFVTYFFLLRLDLVAMWLFVVSSCVLLFGLRPVSRYVWVWALLLMVFSLPYYLAVVIIGGGRGAAGAAALLISSSGTAIAVGRTFKRAAFGFCAASVVGVGLLFALGAFYRDAPMRVYQGFPAVGSMCLVGGTMFLLSRRGTPKRIFERTVEPLASKQVWSAVPLVVGVALVLSFIHLPGQADASVVQRAAPGALVFGQPVVAPRGWDTVARRNYRDVARFYSNDSVLVRQQMTAEEGDPRFDKLSRPRTVMVDSIVSQRPFTFDLYPSRMVYDMTGARISAQREVDLGYGVTGQLISAVDDTLLVTWNALRLAWGDDDLAQRITIFAVDNHDPDAPFPQPSGSTMSTLRTLFTLLFRGNSVLDERTPSFKDAELLTEFGRQLVAAQFTPSAEAG
ncbi:hypothetical protein BH10ACT9_BH10ACT9_23900 [soil metagenome]